MIMGSELLNDASDHDLSAAIPSSGLTLRSTTTMKNCTLYLICLWLITLASLISGYPSGSLSLPSQTFQTRTTPPTFPDYPPSCPICAQGYPSIDSCAQAAPVLANFSMVRGMMVEKLSGAQSYPRRSSSILELSSVSWLVYDYEMELNVFLQM